MTSSQPPNGSAGDLSSPLSSGSCTVFFFLAAGFFPLSSAFAALSSKIHYICMNRSTLQQLCVITALILISQHPNGLVNDLQARNVCMSTVIAILFSGSIYILPPFLADLGLTFSFFASSVGSKSIFWATLGVVFSQLFFSGSLTAFFGGGGGVDLRGTGVLSLLLSTLSE